MNVAKGGGLTRIPKGTIKELILVNSFKKTVPKKTTVNYGQ